MQPQAYCFHKSFDPAGPSEFRMDRHYLLYCLEGTLQLEAQDRRWTLPPARAALIAANKPITLTILSKLTSASVLFSPNFMAQPKANLAVFDMSPLARELIGECRDWGPDGGSLAPYAKQIFAALAQVVLKLAQSPTPCFLPVPFSEPLRRAVEYTELHASGTPGFAEIARATGQSERALARRFQNEMGMTWSEFLRRVRTIRAVEALSMSDTSISEICYSVGYRSLSAFNVAFKELMSMNPSDYRVSCRSNHRTDK